MFFPIQPTTWFTQAETYILPSRFICRLLSPNNSRQLELGYSLPSGDVQNKEEFKTKIKIEEWKAGRMGRVMKHRKSVLFIQLRQRGELWCYTCYSSSYINWPRRTSGKRWQPWITSQQTYTYLNNPSLIYFYRIISDIAQLDPLL